METTPNGRTESSMFCTTNTFLEFWELFLLSEELVASAPPVIQQKVYAALMNDTHVQISYVNGTIRLWRANNRHDYPPFPDPKSGDVYKLTEK